MSDKGLYFIPIIADAIGQDDKKQALEDAFDEIMELGNQPEYAEGYRQFLMFVEEALKPTVLESEHKAEMLINVFQHLIYDLVTDTFRGNEEHKKALIDALEADPKWRALYERINAEAQDFLTADESLAIEVFREENQIGTLPISGESSSIGSIFPGRYSIQLTNGRILWEGELTHRDTIWTYAFPEKDLPMAADTEAFEPVPTMAISILDGEIIIQVFAGLESGTLKIIHEYSNE